MNDGAAPENSHMELLAGLPEPAKRALWLAADVVDQLAGGLGLVSIPADAVFPNALRSGACSSFAHRQLRAALMALHFGLYEAVPPLM